MTDFVAGDINDILRQIGIDCRHCLGKTLIVLRGSAKLAPDVGCYQFCRLGKLKNRGVAKAGIGLEELRLADLGASRNRRRDAEAQEGFYEAASR